MVVHTCSRSLGRPQAGGSQAQGQPLLKASSLSQNNSRIKPVKRAGVVDICLAWRHTQERIRYLDETLKRTELTKMKEVKCESKETQTKTDFEAKDSVVWKWGSTSEIYWYLKQYHTPQKAMAELCVHGGARYVHARAEELHSPGGGVAGGCEPTWVLAQLQSWKSCPCP